MAQVKAGGWIQGGDTQGGNGDSGRSSLAGGAALADESFAVRHDQAGVLGMANVGPHSAASQFYVTLAPCPTFDRNYVAFGRLVDGVKLLAFLEDLDVVNDR